MGGEREGAVHGATLGQRGMDSGDQKDTDFGDAVVPIYDKLSVGTYLETFRRGLLAACLGSAWFCVDISTAVT